METQLFYTGSGLVFVTVVKPLMEVPVLTSMVNLSFWFKERYFDQGEKARKKER